MARAYTTILLDLDHTLFDTDASEVLAFEATLRDAGVTDPAVHLPAYQRINRALWAAVERHEITPGEVRLARFEQFVAATGLDLDPGALADAFVVGLAEHGELYDDARDVLDALAGVASLALVTNGLGEVQRRRIERVGIDRHFDAVIVSAEVGASKPGTRIFDLAFEALDRAAVRADRADHRAGALMVGDSLSSDMRGGRAAGIATCWYDPQGSGQVPEHAAGDVDHRIDALAHLLRLVAG